MHGVFGPSLSGSLIKRAFILLETLIIYMAPSSILIALLSLAMVTGITEARMAPGSEYKNLLGVDDKEVAVAEAIENLMHGESVSFSGEKAKDCHTSSSNNEKKGKVFVRDFEPRPSATAKLGGSYQTALKKDFEPRPNVSSYPNTEEEVVKDFEPRPNISVYQG